MCYFSVMSGLLKVKIGCCATRLVLPQLSRTLIVSINALFKSASNYLEVHKQFAKNFQPKLQKVMHNSTAAATVKLITFTANNLEQAKSDQLAAREVVFIRSKILKIVSPKTLFLVFIFK